jgi:hypothetical protein
MSVPFISAVALTRRQSRVFADTLFVHVDCSASDEEMDSPTTTRRPVPRGDPDEAIAEAWLSIPPHRSEVSRPVNSTLQIW